MACPSLSSAPCRGGGESRHRGGRTGSFQPLWNAPLLLCEHTPCRYTAGVLTSDSKTATLLKQGIPRCCVPHPLHRPSHGAVRRACQAVQAGEKGSAGK